MRDQHGSKIYPPMRAYQPEFDSGDNQRSDTTRPGEEHQDPRRAGLLSSFLELSVSHAHGNPIEQEVTGRPSRWQMA